MVLDPAEQFCFKRLRKLQKQMNHVWNKMQDHFEITKTIKIWSLVITREVLDFQLFYLLISYSGIFFI